MIQFFKTTTENKTTTLIQKKTRQYTTTPNKTEQTHGDDDSVSYKKQLGRDITPPRGGSSQTTTTPPIAIHYSQLTTFYSGTLANQRPFSAARQPINDSLLCGGLSIISPINDFFRNPHYDILCSNLESLEPSNETAQPRKNIVGTKVRRSLVLKNEKKSSGNPWQAFFLVVIT